MTRRTHEPAGKRPSAYRHRVTPRDVPAEVAAKRLGLTLVQFEEALPALLDRGFPRADCTTKLFDSTAIERWMDDRHCLAGGRPLRDADDGYAEKARRIMNG
jgi:hypothetical protein